EAAAAEALEQDVLPEFIGPEPPAIVTVEGQIEPNQFMATMLTDAGLTGGEADRTVHALDGIFDPTHSRPGDRYRVDVFEGGTLARFEYQTAPDEIYVVSRAVDGSLVGDQLDVELEREVVLVDGTIEHSLWLAFENSGESPALAANLTEAFQFDIDFFHDTRKGDRFRFFVEKFTHAGELVRYGQIYAAEYEGSKGSPVGTKRLYWYESETSKTRGYYDETGKAAQRAFLRSPLKYTRISSGFGYRRHPILGKKHFHGGIDYAAPTGTPVRSVADGTVTLATYAGANGKIIKVRHSGGYESYYLHLSKILVKKGQRVSQSTVIGKVGSTGRSTGPHLDFRLKRNGRYLNPRQTVAPRTKSVPKAERSAFQASIASWIERLTASAEVSTPLSEAKSAKMATSSF
ncbi:MAG: peptidoglycan DD-metalloendopeptidase family protein, partial [Myxococcota bacterium]